MPHMLPAGAPCCGHCCHLTRRSLLCSACKAQPALPSSAESKARQPFDAWHLLLAGTQLRASLEATTAAAVAQEAEAAAAEAEAADTAAAGPLRCDAGSKSAGPFTSSIPPCCSSMLWSE